jgi:hypothetical protein
MSYARGSARSTGRAVTAELDGGGMSFALWGEVETRPALLMIDVQNSYLADGVAVAAHRAARLDVLPGQVGQPGGGPVASDCGVRPVMVVLVDPAE